MSVLSTGGAFIFLKCENFSWFFSQRNNGLQEPRPTVWLNQGCLCLWQGRCPVARERFGRFCAPVGNEG